MPKRSLRRAGYVLAAGMLVAGGLLALPATALASLPGASSELTRAPWLTDLTTSSVQVSWATTTQNKGTVEYGPTGSCTANSVTSSTLGTPITVNGVTEYLNSVAVTGLSASTAYCYRITDGSVDLLGSNASPPFTTVQAAGGTQPLTFDVFGDWGDTTNSNVNNGAVNTNQAGVDAGLAASGAQFAVSVGDIAYPGGTQTEYGDLNQSGVNISGVFGPSYWAIPGQSLPVFPVSGNHGQNATFLQEWPEAATVSGSSGVYTMVSYPSIDGNAPASYPTDYYAFSTGGVRFYMLDASWGNNNVGSATGGACGSPCASYQVDHDAHWTASSLEYQWLAADLAAHPGGLKFAFFHFPLHSDATGEPTDPYLDNTPGSSGSLEQLLHDNGVQLAFNGHAHDYQRTIATPGGVTSYVTGGGGASASAVGLSQCSTTDAYAVGWYYAQSKGTSCGAASAPASDSQVYHFLKVTVNGTNVTVTPTDSKGNTFDVQTYNFAPDTTPPSAPGSLTGSQGNSGAVTLNWTSATDNIAVSAYDIYRNGTYLATVGPGVTSYTDSTATSGTGYTYQVEARDLAGNTTGANVPVNGGSVLFSDGFETGDLSNWTSVTGAISVQSSLAHSGSFAAQETSTGSATYARRTLGGSYTELWAQAWVDVVSHSTSGAFFSFRTSSGSSIVYVYVNSSGKLALRNDVSSVTTYSTTAMPTGGWHLVTLHALINGTSSSVDVSLDGTQVPDLTLTGQNLGTTPIAMVQLGDNVTGRTYTIALDDADVSQTNPLLDTTPPGAPGAPTVTSLTSSSVGLTWTPASDNVGVVRYDIIRNGTDIGSTTGTSYTDSTVSASTTYTYAITAYDAAGNHTTGNTTQVTTPAPGAPLFSDGFETGDLSNWTSVTGAISVQSSLVHSGTYAAEETSTGSGTYARVSLGGSYTELWAQAWVDVVSHSTSGAFFSFRTSSGSSIVYVYVNSSGKLALRNDVGSVTTYSATAMPTGSWHLVTLHALINGTTSSLDVSLDGTQVPDLTLTGQNLGTTPIAMVQLGDNVTGRTYDIALDDVAVSQSSL
ncbi:MAG TPA: fibronectin type III domain-containing protein [Streptosporangiaceae bacterium]|nr:fibronectin type III domain-containing protein [Streptosporangiaceae bacterium]